MLDPDLLWQSLTERTYHRNGFQRVPMPGGIGNCVFLNDINMDEIEAAVKTLKDWIPVNHEII